MPDIAWEKIQYSLREERIWGNLCENISWQIARGIEHSEDGTGTKAKDRWVKKEAERGKQHSSGDWTRKSSEKGSYLNEFHWKHVKKTKQGHG